VVTWYEFLLFVHVSGAVIWLGGGFILQVYGMTVERGGDANEMAQFAGRAGHLGERVFVPTALLVVLAGIGLMIEGSWSWGQLWVVFALVAYAVSFALGIGILTPLAKKLPDVGPATPEGQAVIRRIFAVLRVDLVLLFSIVFAMTVKPTTDDGWTVVIAAAIAVALAVALWVTTNRRPVSAEASAAPTRA
jgi:uncharacterized membrane protein